LGEESTLGVETGKRNRNDRLESDSRLHREWTLLPGTIQIGLILEKLQS
jgi:hypothetical protein